jgi:hypothetical protein
MFGQFVSHRYHGWGLWRILGIAIGGLALAVLFGFIFGWFVQLLWNWLMPTIFGLKEIGFWQGFGLVVQAKLLFGAGGHHGPGGPRPWRHHGFGHGWQKRSGDDSADDDLWKPKGSHRNWRYYEQYWKDEGKAAFEAYIERIQNKGNERRQA